MATPIGERAITDAVRVGNAILKFISANDVGRTGGHQCGYYLPKPAWEMFTEHAPTKGENNETEVEVEHSPGDWLLVTPEGMAAAIKFMNWQARLREVFRPADAIGTPESVLGSGPNFGIGKLRQKRLFLQARASSTFEAQ
jgi:hypothetical protein